jgi:hypothetical protein
MSVLDETRYLERRTFFNGEQLLDVDLNDQAEFPRQMRWLHNRSLHQSGVGNGYKVTGDKGDRQVTIAPGYAIDAYGREVVLLYATTLAVPPVAGDAQKRPAFYYLSVSYPDDSALSETEVRQGVCGTRGAVRLAEQPDLCWVELRVNDKGDAFTPTSPKLQKRIDAGLMIVLAQVEIFQCRLNAAISDDSLAPRRSARLLGLPHIASDKVPKPVWTASPIDGLSAPTTAPTPPIIWPAPFKLEATVDTHSGVFAAIPRFLVRISGDRVLSLPDPGGRSVAKVFAEPVISLDLDENQTNHVQFHISVTLVLWIDSAAMPVAVKYLVPTQDRADDLVRAIGEQWGIAWVGIEG